MEKKEQCEIHHEPKNINSDSYGKICVKCYLEIIKKGNKEVKADNQLSIFDAIKNV